MHSGESAEEHTLQHHSACKIISHILVNCNGSYQNMAPYNQSEHRVKGIDDLDLPQHLKDLLHGYVGPIHEELQYWYNYEHGFIHPAEVGPVFTWRGTLDTIKTAKKVVEDESQNLVVRFTLACTYGLKCDIKTLVSRLTPADIRSFDTYEYKGFTVAKVWLAHKDKIAACKLNKEFLRILDERKLCKITRIALSDNMYIARKYLDAIPYTKARQLIIEYFEYLMDKPLRVCPPIFQHRLFKKLSSKQQMEHLPLHSFILLETLLNWPYQGRFLVVAESLVDNLDGHQYKIVSKKIFRNIDSKNYDYLSLISSFFALGVRHKHVFFLAPTPKDLRFIYSVLTVLVQHCPPDIIDELEDEGIISALQTLDIS